LPDLARHGAIALRTLERWLAHYRREGLAGLARHRRRDRGQQRGLQPELKKLIGNYLGFRIVAKSGSFSLSSVP
jgi:putative transposase